MADSTIWRDIRFRIRATADLQDYVKFMQLQNYVSFLLIAVNDRKKRFSDRTLSVF